MRRRRLAMRMRTLVLVFALIFIVNVLIISFYQIDQLGLYRTKNDGIYHDNDIIVEPANRIRLTNLSHIYLDVNKAATYYITEQEEILVMTFLFKMISVLKIRFNVRLRVHLIDKINGTELRRELYNQRVNLLNRHMCRTDNYIFTMLKLSFHTDLCPNGSCNATVTQSSRLTYQLDPTQDEHVWPEYPVNLVNMSRNVEYRARRTARLIKCMWMPSSDPIEFVSIMQLIIEAKYDSIYVCLFARDRELRTFLKNEIIENESMRSRSPRTRIVLIELENVPHFVLNKPDLVHYNTILNDPFVEDKDSLLDPVLEFLLNQIYPFLVDKYQ